jgi:hypothetical protein
VAHYIEIIIENQELDNVTKLQLVQPLSFGDTILCYHRKISHLIVATNCRYLESAFLSGIENITGFTPIPYTTYSARRVRPFYFSLPKVVQITAINALIAAQECVRLGWISKYGTVKLNPVI